MTNIATDVTDLIGGTPLVRINRLNVGGAEIVAKVEAFNPASSVKDRIARSIVDAAEASGELKPGGTIIEATSGNTGVALSMVGAARGYKVVIVMPSSMSVERRILIRAFGAELVLTDPKGGVNAAVEEAERIRDSRRNSLTPPIPLFTVARQRKKSFAILTRTSTFLLPVSAQAALFLAWVRCSRNLSRE